MSRTLPNSVVCNLCQIDDATVVYSAELAPVSLDTTLFNGTEKERGS